MGDMGEGGLVGEYPLRSKYNIEHQNIFMRAMKILWDFRGMSLV